MIDCEYMLLEMEDVPNDAKTYITQEMLDEYNTSLPSEKVLEKYKEEYRYYEQVTKHPFDIELKIDNDGNMKARDICVEINFPEEIQVYRKNERNIPSPQKPSKKINPIDKFYYSKSNQNNNHTTIVGPSLRRNIFFGMDSLSKTDAPNRHFYNENNSLSIRMKDLMTEYQWVIKDEYIIAPKKKGVFKIVCSCICEEYEKSDVQIIEVVVE